MDIQLQQFDGGAQSSPPVSPAEREARKNRLSTRVRADLWKAVWEASQVMSYDEIREHVEGTLREIESDAP